METAQSSFQKLLLFKMKLGFQDLYIQNCRHGANNEANRNDCQSNLQDNCAIFNTIPSESSSAYIAILPNAVSLQTKHIYTKYWLKWICQHWFCPGLHAQPPALVCSGDPPGPDSCMFVHCSDRWDLLAGPSKSHLWIPNPENKNQNKTKYLTVKISTAQFLYFNFFPMHRTLWDDRKFFPSCHISHWWTTSTASFVDLSLIHIWRCRRDVLCRSRWSPYH